MQTLVIFDGVCNLCVGSVRFILSHEARPELRFVPLQSGTGSRMLASLGFDPTDARTFVLVERGTAYVRSAAALRVARFLRWPWRALAALRIVPRPLRDWMYDRIAASRYRWFGRRDACMVPTPELEARFIRD